MFVYSDVLSRVQLAVGRICRPLTYVMTQAGRAFVGFCSNVVRKYEPIVADCARATKTTLRQASAAITAKLMVSHQCGENPVLFTCT